MDQLTLDVQLPDKAGFDTYVPGRNGQIVRAVARHARLRPDPVLWLRGGLAVGKTHLLRAACNSVEVAGELAAYLDAGQAISHEPGAIAAWGGAQFVAIDDIEKLAAMPEWEAAVFALFNQLRDTGGAVLAASRSSPRQAGIVLPDLQSRLSSGPVYQLRPLTDDERLAALSKRAQQRGFELPAATGRYLMYRFPRDLNSLFGVLDRLDDASLQAQRRLTVPFVKQVLGSSKDIEY